MQTALQSGEKGSIGLVNQLGDRRESREEIGKPGS